MLPPKISSCLFGICIAVALYSQTFAQNASGIKVTATIRPLHSIVARIMEGIATPSLLLDRNQSPHHAALRPSQAKLIVDSDILFWIGPDMEISLVRPIGTLVSESKIIPLIDVVRPEILRYSDGMNDPHIWLSTRNAVSIAQEIKTELTKLDPVNGKKYAENLKWFKAEIWALDQEIMQKLSSVKSENYLINHNALQYFEKQFSIHARPVGSDNEELPMGARQIAMIRELAKSGNYRCIFIGQGMNAATIRLALVGTGLRSVAIDPIGSGIPAGPDQYAAMMRDTANMIASCSK